MIFTRPPLHIAGALIVAAFLTYQCTDLSLPPITRKLPSSFNEGERIFNNRVHARYPMGYDERILIADLEAQGFTVVKWKAGDVGGTQRIFRVAEIGRMMFCGSKAYSVRWFADKGRVTEIFGIYGATCL
jgi:hypothetical protein